MSEEWFSLRDPNERPYWQFHLGTAIAMVLIAGVYLYLNVQLSNGSAAIGMSMHTTESAYYGFGFPQHFCTHQVILASYADDDPPKIIPKAEVLDIKEVYSRGKISWSVLFYDLLLGCVATVLFAAPIEFLIRRRDARNTGVT
jgi:hypothetical protein